jgi:hypothetical protein
MVASSALLWARRHGGYLELPQTFYSSFLQRDHFSHTTSDIKGDSWWHHRLWLIGSCPLGCLISAMNQSQLVAWWLVEMNPTICYAYLLAYI